VGTKSVGLTITDALGRKDTIEHDVTLCGFPTASRHAGQQTRRLDRTDIGIR